jgi:hypothetical protein
VLFQFPTRQASSPLSAAADGADAADAVAAAGVPAEPAGTPSAAAGSFLQLGVSASNDTNNTETPTTDPELCMAFDIAREVRFRYGAPDECHSIAANQDGAHLPSATHAKWISGDIGRLLANIT